MRRAATFLAVGVLVLGGSARAEDRPVPCKTNPALVGACFAVHGSLTAHNGTPTFRIWNQAAHRLLGVHGEQDGLPPSLIPILMGANGDAFGKIFTGDYTVCPFTREVAGRMRMVCVEDAKNVKVRWIEH